jgi:hypothetical protein
VAYEGTYRCGALISVGLSSHISAAISARIMAEVTAAHDALYASGCRAIVP